MEPAGGHIWLHWHRSDGVPYGTKSEEADTETIKDDHL